MFVFNVFVNFVYVYVFVCFSYVFLHFVSYLCCLIFMYVYVIVCFFCIYTFLFSCFL
jgi:hypothetical protein